MYKQNRPQLGGKLRPLLRGQYHRRGGQGDDIDTTRQSEESSITDVRANEAQWSRRLDLKNSQIVNRCSETASAFAVEVYR
jgi:hypothetical protein